MVRLGRIVGYALLGLVDALIPAVLTASAVSGFLIYIPGVREYWLGLAVAGVVFFAGAVAGAVVASRGGKPFPVTRTAIATWKRLWWI
jgi:Zn-dependent membrane protease YugP